VDGGFLDTAALTHSYPPGQVPEKIFLSTWYEIKQIRSGKLITYKNMVRRGSKEPRLTLSQTPDYWWHLTAEVSFPTLFRPVNRFLSNAKEIEEGLDKITRYTQSQIALPFSAQTAKTARADFAEDVFVGAENSARILRDIEEVPVKGFFCEVRKGETVYFQNKGQQTNTTIKVYDKAQQLRRGKALPGDVSSAEGILRLEVSIRSTRIKSVERKLNLPNSTAEVFLQKEVANHVLSFAKYNIFFNQCVKPMDDIRSHVATTLPHTSAIIIFAFMDYIERFGPDFYRFPILGVTQRTYRRHLALCREHGINPFFYNKSNTG
jgi:hypothetical protein